jgi:hypothetical protein
VRLKRKTLIFYGFTPHYHHHQDPSVISMFLFSARQWIPAFPEKIFSAICLFTTAGRHTNLDFVVWCVYCVDDEIDIDSFLFICCGRAMKIRMVLHVLCVCVCVRFHSHFHLERLVVFGK